MQHIKRGAFYTCNHPPFINPSLQCFHAFQARHEQKPGIKRLQSVRKASNGEFPIGYASFSAVSKKSAIECTELSCGSKSTRSIDVYRAVTRRDGATAGERRRWSKNRMICHIQILVALPLDNISIRQPC